MKRSLSLLLVLSLLCALLAGCAGKAACPPASDGGNQEPSPKTEGAVARCRCEWRLRCPQTSWR